MKVLPILFSLLVFHLSCLGQVSNSGLVAFYPFNGTADDFSGNGFHGLPNNVIPTENRFGIPNKAYSFNGINSSVTILDTLPFRLSNTDFTISVWLFQQNNNNTQAALLSKRSGAGQNGWMLNIEGNPQPIPGLANFHVSGGSDPRAFSYSTIAMNSWKHLSISYELSSQRLRTYIDGVLDSDTSGIPSPNGSVSSVLQIGADAAGNSYFFNGKLDDVRIYNRLLTPAEVYDLATENLCFQTITVTDTLVINNAVTSYNPLTYNNTIKVYPNPTKDHLSIDISNLAAMNGTSIKIFNSLAQVVFDSPVNQNQFYIDLSSWTGFGIYYLRVYNSDGTVIDMRKIVLQ